VEDTRRERAVGARIGQHLNEMRDGAGASGDYEWHLAYLTDGRTLLDVIALACAVARDAVQHDLPSPAQLHFAHPVECQPAAPAHTLGVAGVLIDAEGLIGEGALAVDPDDDALRAEPTRQLIDKGRCLERGRIHRDFIGSRAKHGFRIRDAADAARDAERDVKEASHALHPGAIHGATVRARRDVVEDELVGALLAVEPREFQDVARVPVAAEAHALYDCAVFDVEAGDDASGKNGCSSFAEMFSSSSARPLTAAATPKFARAARSAAWRMPPEACHETCGKRAMALRYSAKFGPPRVPSCSMAVHNTRRMAPFGYESSACHNETTLFLVQPWV
jgi:hypothetical protein